MNFHSSCSDDRNSSVREASEGTDLSMPGSKTHACLPRSCLSHHKLHMHVKHEFPCSHLGKSTYTKGR